MDGAPLRKARPRPLWGGVVGQRLPRRRTSRDVGGRTYLRRRRGTCHEHSPRNPDSRHARTSRVRRTSGSSQPHPALWRIIDRGGRVIGHLQAIRQGDDVRYQRAAIPRTEPRVPRARRVLVGRRRRRVRRLRSLTRSDHGRRAARAIDDRRSAAHARPGLGEDVDRSDQLVRRRGERDAEVPVVAAVDGEARARPTGAVRASGRPSRAPSSAARRARSTATLRRARAAPATPAGLARAPPTTASRPSRSTCERCATTARELREDGRGDRLLELRRAEVLRGSGRHEPADEVGLGADPPDAQPAPHRLAQRADADDRATGSPSRKPGGTGPRSMSRSAVVSSSTRIVPARSAACRIVARSLAVIDRPVGFWKSGIR